MTLFDRVFGGNDAVYGLTEGAIDGAIAQYGEDKAVSFPNTAYSLPCYYAVTGTKVTTLKELKEIFGNINIVVAKELTKIHETFYRGTIEEVLEKMGEIKGEFIVMFEVHSKTEKELEIEELSKKTIEEQYTYYEKQGLSKKDIIKTIAKNNNVPKDVIYKQFI